MKKIINGEIISKKAKKIQNQVLEDVINKISNDNLEDSQDLELYLPIIDSFYAYLISDVKNATRNTDYDNIRSQLIAEAKKDITFFDNKYKELISLKEGLQQKAKSNNQSIDVDTESTNPVDIADLKLKISNLEKE